MAMGMPTPGWYTDRIVEPLTLTFSLDNDSRIIAPLQKGLFLEVRTAFWGLLVMPSFLSPGGN